MGVGGGCGRGWRHWLSTCLSLLPACCPCTIPPADHGAVGGRGGQGLGGCWVLYKYGVAGCPLASPCSPAPVVESGLVIIVKLFYRNGAGLELMWVVAKMCESCVHPTQP